MNEKIKQLKLEAGIEHNPDQEGMDLFAKLIIEKCAELADCPNSFKHRSGNKIRRFFDVDTITF